MTNEALRAQSQDLATASRLVSQYNIDPETAYRSQTCRRLATVKTKWGRFKTGSLLQDRTIVNGWVTNPSGTYYGKIVYTHGNVWPDGRHEPEAALGDYAPYAPPPANWTYCA